MKIVQLLFSLIFISCSSLAQQTVTLQIKESKVPCTGVAPMECLHVKEDDAKDWSLFYSDIEGFNYEEGYKYTLEVIKSKRDNTPADASSFTYKLKRVIKKEKSDKVNETSNYLNKKMVLTKLNGESVATANVYVTMENGKMYGKSGCNNFNANYKINKGNIEISLILGTMMACEPEAMKLETAFKTALEEKSFKIIEKEGVVTFTDIKTNKAVMEFKIPSQNDIWTFIDGKKWKLIMLDHVAKDYGKAQIQFNKAENRLFGNTGCNSFSGTFQAKADSVKFSEVMATEMACSEGDIMETEAKLLKYFSNAYLRFDVADQTLNFYKDDRLIMIFGLYQE